MTSSIRFGLGTLALGAVTLVTTQGLVGQHAVRNPTLDRMHDAAMELAYTSSPGDIQKAAFRHAHVAYLRQGNDPERFECLRTQAELFEAIGEVDAARFYLEVAAAQAEDAGEVFDAAMTYVDAAILAQQSGDRFEALNLADQARSLMSSSGLDLTERATIQKRLHPAS